MRYGRYYTIDTEPKGDEKPIPLKEIIQPNNEVPEKYFLKDTDKLKNSNIYVDLNVSNGQHRKDIRISFLKEVCLHTMI